MSAISFCLSAAQWRLGGRDARFGQRVVFFSASRAFLGMPTAFDPPGILHETLEALAKKLGQRMSEALWLKRRKHKTSFSSFRCVFLCEEICYSAMSVAFDTCFLSMRKRY